MTLLHVSGCLTCFDIIYSDVMNFRWYNAPLQGLYLHRTTLQPAITEFEMTKSLGQLKARILSA